MMKIYKSDRSPPTILHPLPPPENLDPSPSFSRSLSNSDVYFCLFFSLFIFFFCSVKIKINPSNDDDEISMKWNEIKKKKCFQFLYWLLLLYYYY